MEFWINFPEINCFSTSDIDKSPCTWSSCWWVPCIHKDCIHKDFSSPELLWAPMAAPHSSRNTHGFCTSSSSMVVGGVPVSVPTPPILPESISPSTSISSESSPSKSRSSKPAGIMSWGEHLLWYGTEIPF